MQKFDGIHSVEQLALLQQYIVILTIILGLPGVHLYLKKDDRWMITIFIYFFIIFLLIFIYNKGNKILFPDVTIT